MVPIWSHASVQGIPLDEFSKITGKVLDKKVIEEEVRTAGAKVIQFKGATYYAIAMSISRIVEAIVKDQYAVLPVGSVINDIYGIKDVVISLPAIICAEGISRVMKIDFSDDEKQKLIISSGKIKEVISQISEKATVTV
jgi:L-lactate dehydrogenase